ncbi:type IV pilus biogenesis/stability protein PilW [Neisseriaceae bacterium TC5R-5]|nr:type IV pilus biogenesis/stability protein PilW [Neisseriaceae bacterium TC5R-5]
MNIWRMWFAGGLLACVITAFADTDGLGRQRELAQVRTQLAVEYAKLGNLKVALDTAEQAVLADSTYPSAYIAQAYVLALLQQDGRAEAAYRKALQLEPDNPEANNNYGLFLCERNRIEESLPYFQKALANPLYDSPQTAYLNLGQCNAKVGKGEQANDYLLMALRAAPNFEPALRELAELHLSQGNAKLATFYFERMTARGTIASLSAADLWLGVRVTRNTGDRALEAEYSNVLKSRYPDSKQTQLMLSGS